MESRRGRLKKSAKNEKKGEERERRRKRGGKGALGRSRMMNKRERQKEKV